MLSSNAKRVVQNVSAADVQLTEEEAIDLLIQSGFRDVLEADKEMGCPRCRFIIYQRRHFILSTPCLRFIHSECVVLHFSQF